jgi:hypothetical protein
MALAAIKAIAADVGQIPKDVPDYVRSWFKAVRSPGGVPCCDIADGHRTTWRADKNGGYEVPIAEDDGTVHWLPVPPEAIIYNAGNPVGEAIVWYRDYGPNFKNDPERYLIRCFVPGGGV